MHEKGRLTNPLQKRHNQWQGNHVWHHALGQILTCLVMVSGNIDTLRWLQTYIKLTTETDREVGVTIWYFYWRFVDKIPGVSNARGPGHNFEVLYGLLCLYHFMIENVCEKHHWICFIVFVSFILYYSNIFRQIDNLVVWRQSKFWFLWCDISCGNSRAHPDITG